MSRGRKIRVLLAGPYPQPGGMKGTYGRILDNMTQSAIFADEVEFIPLRMTLPADGNPFKRFVTDLARGTSSLTGRPDILHFIMQKYRALYREFPILKLARISGVKSVVDVRAGTLQWMLQRKGFRIQNGLMRNLLRSGDAVFLECRKDVPFIENRFEREGVYMPNAMLSADLERITPNPVPPGKEQPIRLIHSGRYSVEKGTALLLEVMRVLAERGVRAELHLTGESKDPDLSRKIESETANPPPGVAIIDHGWDVPDLYALMASAHVFAMPTTWAGEGHPNAVSEAMLAGLGLILTDWTHRQDIVPERGAILVPPHDAAAVADAIVRYATEPELLSQARRANRERVAERFVDQVCYRRMLEVYRRLCPLLED